MENTTIESAILAATAQNTAPTPQGFKRAPKPAIVPTVTVFHAPTVRHDNDVLEYMENQRKLATLEVEPVTKSTTINQPMKEVNKMNAVKAPKIATGDKKPTNSSIVREYIRAAKIGNELPDSVVQLAVTNLGMTKALAKVYVANNWPKVTI